MLSNKHAWLHSSPVRYRWQSIFGDQEPLYLPLDICNVGFLTSFRLNRRMYLYFLAVAALAAWCIHNTVLVRWKFWRFPWVFRVHYLLIWYPDTRSLPYRTCNIALQTLQD